MPRHARLRPIPPFVLSLVLSLTLALAGAALAQGAEGEIEGEATTPAHVLAMPVQGAILYDDGETVVIYSPLESDTAEDTLHGFALAGGIVLDVRVETESHNLYFRVSDGYARYQRRTPREGSSGSPGRVVNRDRGPGYVCESGTSSTGSWMRCYDGGRLTYRSRCTVRGANVSCTSRHY